MALDRQRASDGVDRRVQLKTRQIIPGAISGYVAERLVEVYALLSADGRLTSFRPNTDIDHKDMIVDERGRLRNAYVQIKCATRLNKRGEVVCQVRYRDGEIFNDPRLVYIFVRLDISQIALTDIWFVSAPSFNRLAINWRSGPGRGSLVFAAHAGGPGRRGPRGKWNRFRIDRSELGARLLEVIDKFPPDLPLRLPGLLVVSRHAAHV